MQTTESLKLSRSEIQTMCFALAVSLGNLMTIDMYLPSLPFIETSLHMTQALVQHTISIYMLGMAVSVLFCGPLSDVLGRKWIIFCGLLLNIAGSVLCLSAANAEALLIGRMIQGIGAGASLGPARAMISDSISGKKFAIIGSYFGIAVSLSPLFAPALGGYLQVYFSWRANFIVFAIYYCLIALICLFIHETNQHRHLHSFNISQHLKNYYSLITQPVFMTFSFCGGLIVAVSIAYATSGPFILQKTLGLSPVAFGWMGVFVGIGNILGKFITPTLVKRYDLERSFNAGLVSILAAGIILIFGILLAKINLTLIIIAVMLSFFGQGISLPNAMALGIGPYRHIGGATNALWTSMQMGLCFFVSAAMTASYFKTNQTLALTSAYLVIGLSTLAVYSAFHFFRKL